MTTVTPPDPDGSGIGLPAQSTFVYDSVGNLLTETNALGHATKYEYDHLLQRTKTIDALNKATQFTYDKVGNLKSLTDPNSNQTMWTYDALDRVQSETQVGYGSRDFKYDAVGNLRHKTDRERKIAPGQVSAITGISW